MLANGHTPDDHVFYNHEADAIARFCAGLVYDRLLVCNTGWPDREIEQWFAGQKVIFLHHTLAKAIQWAYPNPEQLGKDRMAGLIGASFLFPEKNICVVDAGTCLTIDALQGNGQHLGGTISPGLNMRLAAMPHFTQKLPQATVNELEGYLGNTARACMAAGAVWGLVSEIEYQVAQLQHGLPTPVEVVLTGGDADFLAQRLKVRNFVVSDLVFQGMQCVLASLV